MLESLEPSVDEVGCSDGEEVIHVCLEGVDQLGCLDRGDCPRIATSILERLLFQRGSKRLPLMEIMRKGMSLRAKSLLKNTMCSMDIIQNMVQAQTKTIF